MIDFQDQKTATMKGVAGGVNLTIKGGHFIPCGPEEYRINSGSHTTLFKFQLTLKQQMKPDYRALCEDLLKHFEWYIEEAGVGEGPCDNNWLNGKRAALEAISKTKKVFLENPQEEKDSQYESE